MKKSLLLGLLIFLLLFAPINAAFPGRVLYDDFSSGFLDAEKWWPREYVLEILDGKLVTKLGNSNGMGAEVRPGHFDIPFNFSEPSSIHSIEAEVTIVDARLDSPGAYSAKRIGGYFYNTNDAGGPTGDIFTHIRIGEFGNGGLEAEWTSYNVISDDGTMEFIQSGKLFSLGELEYNKPVRVIISYDGDRTITFSVNGETDVFIGPERKRPAVIQNKGFATTILTENSQEKGFIWAELDNVRINGQASLYDDFSSPLIDTTKWKQREWVREASKGYLRANVIRAGGLQNADTLLTRKDATYVEARVQIDSSTQLPPPQLSPGAYGFGRIQGYYYNGNRGPGSGQDYNRYEGDVFAHVRLRYTGDGLLNAKAFVDRCDKSDESSFTNLFSHDFSLPISLDKYYTLSIRFDGKKLIFGCENETVEYNIDTPMYPAYGEHRLLRSRVYTDPGQIGYIKVRFDDVYIEGKAERSKANPAVLLLLDDEK
jgi:hypothetical protein